MDKVIVMTEIKTRSGKSYKVANDNIDEVLDKIGNEPFDFINDGVVCVSWGGELKINNRYEEV